MKLREEQKAEAVVRLQLMGVMPVVIEDLKNSPPHSRDFSHELGGRR